MPAEMLPYRRLGEGIPPSDDADGKLNPSFLKRVGRHLSHAGQPEEDYDK
jgi:hypothetical protein